MASPLDVEDGPKTMTPMSPSSQILSSSVFSLYIIGFAESQIPIDHNKILPPLRTDLLRVNSRFSSVVVEGIEGARWWKPVNINVEDHVIIPTFPEGLSPEAYTKHFEAYMSKVSMEHLPKDRPLWELHIFKYPTRNAAGTLAFRMNHALGDGFSIMGAVFSCLKRADNPTLPLTFPPQSISEQKHFCEKITDFVSMFLNTTRDFAQGVLRSTMMEDDCSPIRSGSPYVECMPINIATATISLNDINQVKSKIGVTVTEIIVGILFYGIHLYMQAVDKKLVDSRKTGLVVLNTRMLNGYRNLNDMLQKNMWGNSFSFIHIPIPSSSGGEMVDPIKWILQARKTIKRNRNSMTVYLNSTLLKLVKNLRGSKAASEYIYSTLKNTTFFISNLVGPMEQLVIGNHPINSIYFAVTGAPQSVNFTVMSYAGTLKIVAAVEKEFIDSELLISCVNKAFSKIHEDACKSK